MKNKVTTLLLVLLLAMTALCACKSGTQDGGRESDESSKTSESNNESKGETTVDNLSYKETDKETDYVKIEMEDGKVIIIKLEPTAAPITVANFKKLVSEKFYDGIIFHRCIEGLIIQGGDPEGTGYGGSPDKIKGEFSLNGVDNPLSHVRGTISMARTSDPNSASSQFFICCSSYPSWDGSYAAFGSVIYGMDAVDAIASTPVNGSDKPLTEQKMKTVRFVEVTEK